MIGPIPDKTVVIDPTMGNGGKVRVVQGAIGDFIFPKVPINAYLYPPVPLYNHESLAPVEPNSEWN